MNAKRGLERLAFARHRVARRIEWLESKRGTHGLHGQELQLSLWLAEILSADPNRTLADIAASIPFVGENARG